MLAVRPYQPDSGGFGTTLHGHRKDPCARTWLNDSPGHANKPGRSTQGRPIGTQGPQWSAERRAFPIAREGGALRTRAGVFAAPRGFASPATLGASRPLISRAHRAAETRTAARAIVDFRICNALRVMHSVSAEK